MNFIAYNYDQNYIDSLNGQTTIPACQIGLALQEYKKDRSFIVRQFFEAGKISEPIVSLDFEFYGVTAPKNYITFGGYNSSKVYRANETEMKLPV